MLKLKPLRAYSDNYIWALSDVDGRALLVDPGQAEPVLAAVAQGLRPEAILLTHHHHDHVGGVAELLERFDIPCFAPADERIEHVTRRVADGERIRIDSLALDLDVIAVPGHTRSHVAFHGGGYLFCGDTLFSLGCGRLFEGTAEQMLSSLDRLARLPDTTLVCCGHEYTVSNASFARAAEPDNPDRDRRASDAAALQAAGWPTVPSNLGSERACNPFLRIDEPGVRRSLAHNGWAEAAAGDRTAAFAALRSWKDGFVA